jgi:hypothetical protein
MVGVDGTGFTVIVIAFEFAVAAVTQVRPEVIVHVTTSLVANVLDENVVPVPDGVPFTNHWYVGVVPPFVGVAVNVTGELVQLGFDPVVIAILTAGVTGVVIVTVVEACVLVQPPTVTVTLYVPAIAAVALGREGSSKLEVNPEGPVQL